MQITETSAEGLKREIQVVVPIQDLNKRCDKRLEEMKGDVQLPGFRKGRVPKVHLKKVYGRRLMLEIVQEAVEQSSKEALIDRNERPAVQPEISLSEDAAEIESIVSGSKDLSYSMKYEIIPTIELVDVSNLEVERLTADVEQEDLDKELDNIVQRSTIYEADNQAEAQDADKLKIDFSGRVDGELFEGGSADDVDIVIGQGSFIAGFEEGLKGAKAGQSRLVTTTFPQDYPVETLQGKEAVFDVTVKEVGKPKVPLVDDELARSVGVEDLDSLKKAIKERISHDYEKVSRSKVKRKILDLLDEKHAFELPQSLLEAEFEGIWKEFTQNMEKEGKSFESSEKSEDELRADYRKLAERRVRLGLVISEIGERFEIKVEQSELREALVSQARRFPGQEQLVYEYFEKQPGAISELRAPIFEEKVVDLLLSKMRVTDCKVSKQELFKPFEDDEDGAQAVNDGEVAGA